MKNSNLYLGLVLPSGGCQSLIRPFRQFVTRWGAVCKQR